MDKTYIYCSNNTQKSRFSGPFRSKKIRFQGNIYYGGFAPVPLILSQSEATDHGKWYWNRWDPKTYEFNNY